MCDACHPKEITKTIIDEMYPPQLKPKPISLEWEDIEYKPPTY
jgi:hypothetical protein